MAKRAARRTLQSPGFPDWRHVSTAHSTLVNGKGGGGGDDHQFNDLALPPPLRPRPVACCVPVGGDHPFRCPARALVHLGGLARAVARTVSASGRCPDNFGIGTPSVRLGSEAEGSPALSAAPRGFSTVACPPGSGRPLSSSTSIPSVLRLAVQPSGASRRRLLSKDRSPASARLAAADFHPRAECSEPE